MKFEKHLPSETLKPYIRYFVVSENPTESAYKVFPSSGLVMGFQYQGQLTTLKDGQESKLSTAGISGMTDRYKIFKNSAHIKTVLVYFTEVGFTHFTAQPAHELFNLSLSLDDIFSKSQVAEVEEKLAGATTDAQRIQIIERFLSSQLKHIATDQLIVRAVQLIYQSGGTLRIKDLTQQLAISPSPFEKRFRKVVGTSAKKFASMVRFNTVLGQLNQTKSLAEICYENNFFDQAHFIKDFKQFTGDTPENFKRFL